METDTSDKIVLLVEDSSEIGFVIKHLLEAKGYLVFWAENGHEAIRKLDILNDAHRPCLILCDLAMPVMDGWEFIERCGKQNRLLTIPLVIHSGQGEAPQGYPVLKKPADLNTLIALVEKHCGKGRRSVATH